MTDAPKPWSTVKVLLAALAITFVVMFLGNGVFNELLELDVPTWVFSMVAGVAMVPVIFKWTAYRRIVADAPKMRGGKGDRE